MTRDAHAQALKSRQSWLAKLGGQECYFCQAGDAARARVAL